MKLICAALLFVLTAASPAFAQWKSGGEPAPDTPDRKSVKGFGGHLIVVEDPQGFIKEWLKPEPPQIHPAAVVKGDKLLGAFVLFAGCKPDAERVCNAEVDYALYKPDGSLLEERKAQPLWKKEAPPAPNVQLSSAILVFGLARTRPDGEYKVKAVVHDLNADVSFELETKFSLKH